jgi:hypothetical protein
MSQIVLTLKQNGFRSRLQGYIVKENLLTGINEVRDLPERLEKVTGIARRMPGGLPEDTDQKTLEIICSAVISTLCESPVLAAVVNAREVDREKNRAIAAAKKRSKEGELMGTVDLEEADKEPTVPFETTKTVLAGVPSGVHFLRDDRGASRKAIELEIAKVPIDESGLVVLPPEPLHESQTVTPWQEPDLEMPEVAPNASKEGTHSDKNLPTPSSEPETTSHKPMATAVIAGSAAHAMHDPFESAFAEEAAARKGDEVVAPSQDQVMDDAPPTTVATGSQEVAAANDAPSESVATPVTSSAPQVVVDHQMDDIEEVDTPAGVSSAAVAAEVKEVEAALSQATKAQTARKQPVEVEEVVPATPPQADHAGEAEHEEQQPEAHVESTKAAAATVASEENESASEVLENQEPHDMLVMAAQLAFHLKEDVLTDPYLVDATTVTKLKVISRAVESVLLRIEDSEDDNNKLHYDLDPPVSNWFLDKANCAWLVVMLNYIEVVTQKDVEEALDDIESLGYPTRLLSFVAAKSPKAQKKYYLSISDKASIYLKSVSIKKSLGQAIPSEGVFSYPKCVLDFVPKAWVDRYCDELTRDFYDINAKRKASGLEQYASIAHMKVAPDFEKQREIVDKERDEEDDDSFDEEDEKELEEDDFDDDDGEVDLEAKETSKKRKNATPRARNPNPGVGSKEAADSEENKTKADRRKSSAPKKNAGASKREGSPLPEMRPKLKFVAESVCERYDDVRAMAQDSTPKRRDTLTKEADAAAAAAGDSKDKPKKKQRTKSSSEKTEDDRALDLKLQLIKQLMPVKLQAGLTIERISEGIEAVLTDKEVPNASAKRAIADGAHLAHHQMVLVTSAVIDIDLRKRLTRILNAPTMICSAPTTSRFYRTVCSLTSEVLENVGDVAYLKLDASDPDYEGVRIHAKFSAHFVAINFMLRLCTCASQHTGCARAPVGDAPGRDAAVFLFAYCHLLKAAASGK